MDTGVQSGVRCPELYHHCSVGLRRWFRLRSHLLDLMVVSAANWFFLWKFQPGGASVPCFGLFELGTPAVCLSGVSPVISCWKSVNPGSDDLPFVFLSLSFGLQSSSLLDAPMPDLRVLYYLLGLFICSSLFILLLLVYT